ncbi:MULTISPECIES: hypothetical protein [Moorena]|nr:MULTISPECIES: hypothetical protein [Moorena]NEP69944.1 hypothetical protein [Moorena sp. SIO3A5]NEQ12321.1 hypothetical protein [Moorena sp. SIO4E2]
MTSNFLRLDVMPAPVVNCLLVGVMVEDYVVEELACRASNLAERTLIVAG